MTSSDEIKRAIDLIVEGDLDAAREIFQRIEQELRAGIDDDERDRMASITVALQRFGEGLLEQEDLGRAGFVHEAAVHLRRAAGFEDETLAHLLHNLGSICQMTGDLDRARACYQDSLDLQNRFERTSLYENTVNNLALLETKRRNDPAAKLALEELLQTELPADEEWVRSVQLANASVRLGDFETAERLVQKLFALARDAGEHSRRHGLALSMLANVLEARGQTDDAFALRLKSLERIRSATDARPADLSAALNNVGSALLHRREIARAIPYLEEALALKRGDPNEDASELASNLSGLAIAYIHGDRADEATPLMEEALSLRRTLLPEGHISLSESLFNLAMTHVNAMRFDDAIPLLREQLQHEGIGIHAAFTVASERERLAYVRRLLDRFDTMNEMLFPHTEGHPEITAVLFEAAIQRKALVAERMAAERDALARGLDVNTERTAAELKTIREQLANVTLGRTTVSAHEYETMRDRRRDLERQLARALPAIDRIASCDCAALAGALPPRSALCEIVRFVIGRGRPTEEIVYVLFVLPDAEPGKLTMIVLGVENDLAASDEIPQFLPALDGRRRVFIAPDGIFHRFPFEALLDESAQPLFETYEISYLDTGRDLLRIAHRAPAPSSDPIVIADPDFNLGGDPSLEEPYAPLLGTLVEGSRVAALLRVKPWTGADALEARLKAARSPRILHLATHGFFDPDPSDAAADLDAAMLRSGLALAGANTASQGGTLPAEAEDGVLYAQDVLAMDLSGTELVVLSACETGLGSYQRGEGVFGLRRAFFVAGARALLVSLWPVPDEATAILMENFYRALLGGKSCTEALRIARRAVMEFDDSPQSWAAFILIGAANT